MILQDPSMCPLVPKNHKSGSLNSHHWLWGLEGTLLLRNRRPRSSCPNGSARILATADKSGQILMGHRLPFLAGLALTQQTSLKRPGKKKADSPPPVVLRPAKCSPAGERPEFRWAGIAGAFLFHFHTYVPSQKSLCTAGASACVVDSGDGPPHTLPLLFLLYLGISKKWPSQESPLAVTAALRSGGRSTFRNAPVETHAQGPARCEPPARRE